MENKIGPRIEPWGTPYILGAGNDEWFPIDTKKCLSDKYEVNHWSTQTCNLAIRMAWSMVSEAGFMLSNIRIDGPPLSAFTTNVRLLKPRQLEIFYLHGSMNPGSKPRLYGRNLMHTEQCLLFHPWNKSIIRYMGDSSTMTHFASLPEIRKKTRLIFIEYVYWL